MVVLVLSKDSQRASFFATCAAGVLAGYVILQRWWRSRKLPPGSMGWPLLGETLAYVSDQEKFIEARLLKYGGTFKSNVLFVPTVFLAVSESNAKLIHSKRDLGWPAHFKKVVGESSVPMVNDPLHKRLRNMTTRAFTNQQLDVYLPTLQALSVKYLKQWAAESQAPKDLYFAIKKYAFECGQAVVLGSEITEGELDHFMHLFDTSIAGIGCILPVDLPGFPFHACMSARRRLGQECQKVIDRRRKALQTAPQETCMLDAMLGSDQFQSDQELQDFCVSMTFAGHDTTLSSIHSTLRWLKELPELASNLKDEVEKTWDGKSPITRSLLESMPKSRAFLQEVWRKTPPVLPIVRNLAEELEVDGYVVPKGWNLSYYPAGQFSKVEMWDEFLPSRHLDKGGQFVDTTFEPTLFESFGGGSRMCIGYKFARDELLVFLMVFLKGYDLSLTSSKLKPFPFRFYRLEGSFFEPARS